MTAMKSSPRRCMTSSGNVHVELAVDAEPTDLAQPIAVLVEELFLEERLGFVPLRGVAGAKSAVDPQQGGLVLGGLGHELKTLHRQRIEDERVARVLHDGELLDVRGLNCLE